MSEVTEDTNHFVVEQLKLGDSVKTFEMEDTGFVYLELVTGEDPYRTAVGMTLSPEDLKNLRDFINTIL